jgi:opacity protein-like surface antigen
MKSQSPRAHRALLIVVAACLISPPVAFASPLDVYAGASVGQSTVKADPIAFNQHTTGWTILVGIRPVALLGAEIAYTDFGHPNYSQGVPGGFNASAHASSTEALGILYLPIPVPLLDVYGKAGVARLHYGASSSSGCLACVFFNTDSTETRVAYGAGAQLKFDRLAVRVEYQRVRASNGDPSLLSVGITWKLL